MKEQIEHFFKTHPQQNEVHQTADGNLFIENHHAQAYANERLEDKKVTAIERPKVAGEEVEAKEEVKEEKKANKKG